MMWWHRLIGRARLVSGPVSPVHVLGHPPPTALPATPMPLDEGAFLRRLEAAKGDAARALVLQDALKVLPPRGLRRLYAELARQYPHGAVPVTLRRAVPFFGGLLRRNGDDLPHYRAEVLSPFATFYRARPGGRRCLLVCFTGRNHHLFSHVSLFLMSVGAVGLDVLVLRHGARADYRTGVPGLAGSLHGIAAALPRLVALDRYARVTTLGVSLGGLAALSVADTLRADAAVALGAVFPRVHEPVPLALSGPAFDRFCATVHARPVHTTMIHGTADPLDCRTAERLCQWNPAILRRPVVGAGHNPVRWLAARGHRGTLFNALKRHVTEGRPIPPMPDLTALSGDAARLSA